MGVIGVRSELVQYTPSVSGAVAENLWIARRPGAVQPPLLYIHGAAQIGPNGMISPNGPSTTALLIELAQYFTVGFADLGGDRWGGTDHIARIEACRSTLSTLTGANQTVTLVGESMGALGALNYTRAYPSNVRAVLPMIPVLNLDYFRLIPGPASTIDPWYPPSGYSESTHGSMHNPVTYAASLPSTLPIRIYYSGSDAAIPPAYHITPFLTARPQTTAIDVGTDGHTEATIASAKNDAVYFAQFLTPP